MPIYEYKCSDCGHRFERLARNSEDHPDACPECRAAAPVKQFSTFAPGAGKSGADRACPAQSECPTGACCSTGKCPF